MNAPISARGSYASAPAQPAKKTLESLLDNIWAQRVFVGVLIAYCLFPVFWLIRLSLDPNPTGKLLPSTFNITNYVDVLKNPEFISGFINSVIVAGIATTFAMIVGGCAGYALARLDVPGKQAILFFSLSISMFPAISIIGPLFQMWRSAGLFDTKIGLIIPCVTFALPMAIWIMTAFFRELPRDLEQAAAIDGATPFQAFRTVMLPLAAPGVFTAAILVFIAAWNEFLFAVSFSATESSRTVPVVIAFFQGKSSYEVPVGSISAASIVVMVPLIIMVLAFQKRIVAGLTAGGVKG